MKDGYGFILLLMERNTKANGKKENIMEKVFTHGLVAQSMRVIEDDKRTGYGTYIWPDGDKYIGEYKDDENVDEEPMFTIMLRT